MRMNRRVRRAPPYVPPLDAPPLEEVVRDVVAKPQIALLDESITQALRRIERQLEARGYRRIVRVKLEDGAELAWSMGKRGRWRLVIRDEEGTAARALIACRLSSSLMIEMTSCAMAPESRHGTSTPRPSASSSRA